MEQIKVTTFNQLQFHLNSGELVVFKLTNGEGYIRLNGQEYEIITQAKKKKHSDIVKTPSLDLIEQFFNSMKEKTNFFVNKGDNLIFKIKKGSLTL